MKVEGPKPQPFPTLFWASVGALGLLGSEPFRSELIATKKQGFRRLVRVHQILK